MADTANFVRIAREFDRREDSLGAAWAYEVALSTGQADLECVLDLAVVYFECLDDGVARSRRLPDGLVAYAHSRMKEILQQATRTFGQHDEVEFWEAYVDFIYGEGLDFDRRCHEWCKRRQSLVPFFYTYVFLKERRHVKEATTLFEIVKGGETERKRYIRSVLSAPRKGRAPQDWRLKLPSELHVRGDSDVHRQSD